MLILLLVLKFIGILAFWSWWFKKYLTCMGNNLTTILQLLMKRYLQWFVINLIKLLHIVLYMVNTFKVWNVTYTSLYFTTADGTRSVTKRNCSNTNNLCWNRHTLNNISICITLYILITNTRYFEYFNTDILFPDFFPPSKCLPCKFMYLFCVHATILPSVFWKPLIK